MLSEKAYMPNLLTFEYLPGFAELLLTKKLREYIEIQLSVAKELDIHILRHFAHLYEEELVSYSMKVYFEFISFLATNDFATFLKNSLID